MLEDWDMGTNTTFDACNRVGMILERKNPARLVHRFGYVLPARASSLGNDHFVGVLWDDGENDLVEKKKLRALSSMNENPLRYPVISYADEICDFPHRRERLVGYAGAAAAR